MINLLKNSRFLITIYFAVILTSCSEDPKYYKKKGEELLNNGKTNEAIESFTKAIEIKPDDTYAYYYRGTAYKR